LLKKKNKKKNAAREKGGEAQVPLFSFENCFSREKEQWVRGRVRELGNRKKDLKKESFLKKSAAPKNEPAGKRHGGASCNAYGGKDRI